MERDIQRLAERLENIWGEVKSIGDAVRGDPKLGNIGLVPRIANLESSVAELKSQNTFERGKHYVINAAVSALVAGIIAWIAARAAAPAPAPTPTVVIDPPRSAPIIAH